MVFRKNAFGLRRDEYRNADRFRKTADGGRIGCGIEVQAEDEHRPARPRDLVAHPRYRVGARRRRRIRHEADGRGIVRFAIDLFRDR
jgi:hypothetical protein